MYAVCEYTYMIYVTVYVLYVSYTRSYISHIIIYLYRYVAMYRYRKLISTRTHVPVLYRYCTSTCSTLYCTKYRSL